MSLKRNNLRRIVSDGETYLWKVKHDHNVLFLEPSKGSRADPVRIRFADGPGQSSGYPAAEVVWTSGPDGLMANLNTPHIAVALIRHALSQGRNPVQHRTLLIMDDEFFLLKELSSEQRSTR
jgi:hypothetical protein